MTDLRTAIAGRTVLQIPEAGRLFWGLGRDASYAAARRGEIPCVTFGRKKVSPVHANLRLQGMSDDLIAKILAPEHGDAGPSTDPAPNDSTPDQGARRDESDTPTPASSSTLRAVTGL